MVTTVSFVDEIRKERGGGRERDREREATLEATARGDGDIGEQRFERIRRLNALRNL